MTIVSGGALAAALCFSCILAVAADAQFVDDSITAALKARLRQGSPLLAARQAAIDVAHAQLRAAGLNPAAILAGEVEEASGLNVADANSMRLDLSRELAPRGRRRAERAIAAVELDRARLELDLATRAVDAGAERLLTTAGGSAAIAARLASEDSLLASAEEALRSRFAAAEARYVDVLRLRTERLRVGMERRRAEADHRIARRQLIMRLGANDSTEAARLVDRAIVIRSRHLSEAVVAPRRPPAIVPPRGAQQLATLDVARAQRERDLARAESRSAIAPSIGVQRFEDSGISSVALTAGLSLSLPFATPAGTGARIAAAERRVAQARARARAIQSRTELALAAAADRYESLREAIATLDVAQLRGAREEREAALAAYRAGDLALIELLDFERALSQAEVSRLRAHTEAAEALLQYVTAALGSSASEEDR